MLGPGHKDRAALAEEMRAVISDMVEAEKRKKQVAAEQAAAARKKFHYKGGVTIEEEVDEEATSGGSAAAGGALTPAQVKKVEDDAAALVLRLRKQAADVRQEWERGEQQRRRAWEQEQKQAATADAAAPRPPLVQPPQQQQQQHAPEASSAPVSDSTAAAAEPAPSPVLSAVNQHMSNKNQFILLLGDHTYQQYGVCVQLPMTFHAAELGVVIQTSYVLCLMTKLPVFSYLFHILDQFDVLCDGFKFKDPVPTQDVNFPFVAELKPLSDLAARLKRILVPKYPYIISNANSSSNLNSGGGNRSRLNTGVSVSGGGGGTGGANASDFPSLENELETKVVLPDIDFTYFGGLNINAKKFSATFKRCVYQAQVSPLQSLPYDSGNKLLNDIIARYDSTSADFAPNSLHKFEKEKEDSYMVMLWALPVLLKYLPLDQIVLALGCAITEMKIIVKHPDFHVVSAVILALIQLLRPMRWCSPVIVILPDELVDFIGGCLMRWICL